MVKPLLKDVKLKGSLMDGAYDKEEVFKFMKEKGVTIPGIEIRKNAIVKADSARAESVLEFKKYGYDSWKMVHGYGRRWAAESVFSAIKRIFGETVRATSTAGMFREAHWMLAFYRGFRATDLSQSLYTIDTINHYEFICKLWT
jgi:hypothetical protein